MNADVADAVDDERLLAGVGRRSLLIPEPDQQVRAEPHALPAHEHDEQAVAQHEQQHERGEEVQVREVARVLRRLLLDHVGRRIDVDEEADAGDDQDHHRRQRIEPEPERHLEVRRADPGEQRLLQSRAILPAS